MPLGLRHSGTPSVSERARLAVGREGGRMAARTFGSLATGALATERGRGRGRKSEAESQISRELGGARTLSDRVREGGPVAAGGLKVLRDDEDDGGGGPGHLSLPAMEASAPKQQQQPATVKIRNLPW